MSDVPEKKLSLKERMALKKAAQQAQGIETKIEEFVPTPQTVVAPSEANAISQQVEGVYDGSAAQQEYQQQEPEPQLTEAELAQLTHVRSMLNPQHHMMAQQYGYDLNNPIHLQLFVHNLQQQMQQQQYYQQMMQQQQQQMGFYQGGEEGYNQNFGNFSQGNNHRDFWEDFKNMGQDDGNQGGQMKFTLMKHNHHNKKHFKNHQQQKEEEEDAVVFDFDTYNAGGYSTAKNVKEEIVQEQVVKELTPEELEQIRLEAEAEAARREAKRIAKLKKEEIVDEDKIKSKHENQARVFDYEKDAMNIIVIGHVDSGKSTICGNMMVLSGKVDEDELKKYEQEAKEKGRESWIWAYVMDINSEERDKGKTVEVGKAQFDLPHKRYTILDCPGHKNYVPNMISGVAQADVAALVVSAKAGEFEAGFERAGQTREHAILASNMGSGYLIVIVNKMDECEWKKDRFDYIKANLTPFLKDTCGYDVETRVIWVPVSGFRGLNINSPIGKEVCPWYDGKTLLDTLDTMPKVERIERNCLRIPVFDAFKDQGNLIVFGKLESGIIKEGQKLTLMPTQKEFTCLKIIDNEDKEIAMAKSGDNIKMHVKGVEIEEIRKGMMICGLQFRCHVSQCFEAEITVINPPENKVVSTGFCGIIHLHTIQEEVRISKILTNTTSNQKGGMIVLKQGQTGTCIIESDVPLCVEKFSEFPEIARFSIRAESSTIAVGKVLRLKPLVKYTDSYHDYYAYLKEQESAPKQESEEITAE